MEFHKKRNGVLSIMGRPRSVQHREDGKFCRCAECRAHRGEKNRKAMSK